jgi:uncharacterized RDD family membrane protein YckC
MPSPPPALGAPMRPLELEVTGGPAAGQQFSVHEDFTVGSGESVPGNLGGDRWLSSSHALFHRGPDGWAVQDLRSLEGTKVNGRAVQGAASLAPGDVVELGATRIVVLPDGVASAAQLAAANPANVARSIRAESRRSLDGRRLLAYLIDSLVVGLAGLGAYEWGRGRGVFLIGAVAVGLTYYFLCESLTGQTLGKRITGLRVVRIDGRPLTPSAVAGRTVLRLLDQFAAGLVGMLTMILSGGRRQRLGDLAARTAVARASAAVPPPARTTLLERIALWAYPCVWIAPAVLLFVLVPDVRLLPCHEVGISSASGTEGSCLVQGPNGEQGVFDVANSGHTLRMPGFSVRLVRTRTRPAPRALRGARYYRNGSTTVVGLKLAVRNTGDVPLRFDRNSREVVLGAPNLGGQMVAGRELPPAARPGFRSFARSGPIAPGRTRTAWVSFGVPPGVVSQLRQPVAGLAILHPGSSAGYQHYGELRLWRAATPAGARALRGLRD